MNILDILIYKHRRRELELPDVSPKIVGLWLEMGLITEESYKEWVLDETGKVKLEFMNNGK